MNKKTGSSKSQSKQHVRGKVVRGAKGKPERPAEALVRPKKDGKLYENLDGIRCGVKPFKGVVTVSVNLDAISNYAEAIVNMANDRLGVVPSSGDDFCYGNVYFYIQLCLLAYLDRCGMLGGDVSLVAQYSKYYVPTWLAVLFQNCAPWKDKKSGAEFTMDVNGYDYAYVSGLTVDEANSRTQVITSVYAAYNNEPVFSLTGSGVNFATITGDTWEAIAETIASIGSCVPVSEIHTKASSHQGLVTSKDSGTLFYSVKGFPACITPLPLFYVDDHLGPFSSRLPVCSSGTLSASSDAHTRENVRYLYAYYGCDVKYHKGLKPSYIFAKHIGDPYRFSITYHSVSFSKLWGLMWDWCRRSNLITINATLNASVSSFLGNLASYWWAAVVSRSCFVSRMNVGDGDFPNYMTPNFRSAALPTFLGVQGFLPTHSKGCIYLPVFRNSANNPQTFWQVGMTCTASFTWSPCDYPCTIVAPGLPASTTYAGFTPAVTTTRFNLTPIRLQEELESAFMSYSSNFNSQTIPFPHAGAACPCDTGYVQGSNIDAFGILTVYFPSQHRMSCNRPVSKLECLESNSCGLFTDPLVTVFSMRLMTASQNPFRKAVNSAQFNNNITTNSGTAISDPVARAKKIYESEMLADSGTQIFNLTGKQLWRMANDFIDEGGEVAVPPNGPAWLKDIETKVIEIYPLVANMAGLLTTMTGTGIALVKGYKNIRAAIRT